MKAAVKVVVKAAVKAAVKEALKVAVKVTEKVAIKVTVTVAVKVAFFLQYFRCLSCFSGAVANENLLNATAFVLFANFKFSNFVATSKARI